MYLSKSEFVGHITSALGLVFGEKNALKIALKQNKKDGLAC